MNSPKTGSTSSTELVSIVDNVLQKVQTLSLDISFNELLDMKDTGELDISPDYQRLFRWTEGAQSRFIESLLLEMPVPPIYVIEEESGQYLLIDGLQRLSSYLHFRGKLSAMHQDPPVEFGKKLVLSDCDIVTELNGKTFDDLSVALQIRIKRAFVRVEVVRKGSDARFKYHMFKRLNTGGEQLSNQQLRNCTIRLLNPKFNDFIIDLSKREPFQASTSILTQEQKLSAFDQELVLRFFALKNNRDNFKHDVADFLTDYMEAVSDPDVPVAFDYDKEEALFLKTFTLFQSTLGEKAFGSTNKGNITKGFSVYHFEGLTIGLQKMLQEISIDNPAVIDRMRVAFASIKLDDDFIATTGGGKNSVGPLRRRIEIVERFIENSLL